MTDGKSKKSLTFRVTKSIAVGGIAVATMASLPGCIGTTNPAPENLDGGAEDAEDDTDGETDTATQDTESDANEDAAEDTDEDGASEDANSSDAGE